MAYLWRGNRATIFTGTRNLGRALDSGGRSPGAKRLRFRTSRHFLRWRWKSSITPDLPGYKPDWVLRFDVRHTDLPAPGTVPAARRVHFGAVGTACRRPAGHLLRQRRVSRRSILIYLRAMVLPDLQLPRGDAAGASAHNDPPNCTPPLWLVCGHTWPAIHCAIHWRQTAHHGEFMVKEFDLEPSSDLWITARSGCGCPARRRARSTLEYAITLTASLASEMLAENRRVGLVTQGG